MCSLFKLSKIVTHLVFFGLRDTCKQLLDQSERIFTLQKLHNLADQTSKL